MATEKGFEFPDIYPRLAYRDERAAIEYLERVFQLKEIREARAEHEGNLLAWLRLGQGVVMVGRENAEVHRILSPAEGHASVQIMVRVQDIDAHYARSVSQHADITTALEDTFFGERRYEATDLEGHRWCFLESFDAIRARNGREPGPES